jgi:hypothetical protein
MLHHSYFYINGPEPTLTTISSAAVQLPQSGHWMQAAAFCGLIREATRCVTVMGEQSPADKRSLDARERQ